MPSAVIIFDGNELLDRAAGEPVLGSGLPASPAITSRATRKIAVMAMTDFLPDIWLPHRIVMPITRWIAAGRMPQTRAGGPGFPQSALPGRKERQGFSDWRTSFRQCPEIGRA